MDRATIAKLWDEAWKGGLWAAAWEKAVDGLTSEQAAREPAPGRHSVWRIVNHMLFWREHELGLLAGRERASDEEIAKRNFAQPAEVTEAAWAATRERLAKTQRDIAAALADPNTALDRIAYLLPHDCYHVGQIMYARALLGLKPLD